MPELTYEEVVKERLNNLAMTLDWGEIQTLSNAAFWHRSQATGQELVNIAKIDDWLERIKRELHADILDIKVGTKSTFTTEEEAVAKEYENA